MSRTNVPNGPSTSPASRWSAASDVAAYAAAIVAFGYALMSLYWALGGSGLVSTIGGYVQQFAHRGGALPVLVLSRRRWPRSSAACWRWSGPGGGPCPAGGCCEVQPRSAWCWCSTAV